MTESSGEGANPSRETYDAYWLHGRSDERSEAPQGHEEVFLTEMPGSRGTVAGLISSAIVDHHFHRARIADRLADLGYSEAAAFFADELPKTNNTRKGNFGEVIASEHLIQRYGFRMPVFKLRFRDVRDMPMRGEDIVAFRMNQEGQIEEVIVGEAKTVVRYRGSTVKEAHDRLREAYYPRPMTLSMLSEILYESGNAETARQIDRVSDALARGDFDRSNWIFLINEKQPADAFACLDDKNQIPNLNCIGIELPGLTEFINSLFERPSIPEK